VGKWKFLRKSKILCALTRGQVGFEKNYEALRLELSLTILKVDKPKIMLTTLVSTFWEEEFIVIFFVIKISISLHNSTGIKQLKFAQNFQVFYGIFFLKTCFKWNNKDSDEPVLWKTFWNKGLRQAKHDTTAACPYKKVEQVYPSLLKAS
jgi:fumarate reductase subunit D